MSEMDAEDRSYWLGVIAGLAAKQEQQGTCCGRCGGGEKEED